MDGLFANTLYQFRVRETCIAPKSNSPPSDETDTIRTLPFTATIWRVYAKQVIGSSDVEIPWAEVFEQSDTVIMFSDHNCLNNLTAEYSVIDNEIDANEGSATFGQQVNYLRFNFKDTVEVNCVTFEALSTAPASVDIYLAYNEGSNADGSIAYVDWPCNSNSFFWEFE